MTDFKSVFGALVSRLVVVVVAVLPVAIPPAFAADFCSDVKRIAAAAPTGFDGMRGAETRQDGKLRYYKATGWPAGATGCEIEENLTLMPKGARYYACKFPLTTSDKGKAQVTFAGQVAKCVGGQAEDSFTPPTKDGGSSTVEAKNFYAVVETSSKRSNIEMRIGKPGQ